MIIQGIKIIFANTKSNNWDKLNPEFVNLLFGFFKAEGIQEIFVNSTFRINAAFHSVGMAIDLHYVKYNSGKVIYFSRREKNYKRASDLVFSNSLISHFEKYRIEYFSPSRIYSIKADRFNKYADLKQDDVNEKLEEKKLGKVADLDRDHLDHLHIAINPDLTAKPKAQIKTAVKTILPLAIFFF